MFAFLVAHPGFGVMLTVMFFGTTTPVVAVTWYLTALAALSLAAVAIARRRYAIR
ncbi:hypothetical protein ABZ370_25690 [Streptomyces sp. NPDC005962]|uniref:hypothetical protein n=1 Tax=Streptomyces sp. NPDC005962 TaxID=3154466 RepID=UPI0033DDB059